MGDDLSIIDRHMQYIWGPRYADDIICRRVDTNLDGFSDDFYYHLTDVQFSSVAIVDESGIEFDTLERISYDPYGLARHHQFGDLNGDGATNSTDLMILLGNWGAFGPGDLNRDGTVNVTDMLLLNANNAPALPFGQLSDSVTDSIVGYDGYLMSAYDTAYLARNRFYEPDRGRWLNRDPAGYVNGMSLFEYGMSSPAVYTDPLGLEGLFGSYNMVDPTILRMFRSGASAVGRSVLNGANALSGGRLRRSGGIVPIFKDQQGKYIFDRWMEGGGQPLHLLDNEWRDYMMANDLLRSQMEDALRKDALCRTESGLVNLDFHGEIEDGYTTGYQMLHGSHRDKGDVKIYGMATVRQNGMERVIEYELRFQWGDIIDPNMSIDWPLAIPLQIIGDPHDYEIYIRWEGDASINTIEGEDGIIRLGNIQEGYPFESDEGEDQ